MLIASSCCSQHMILPLMMLSPLIESHLLWPETRLETLQILLSLIIKHFLSASHLGTVVGAGIGSLAGKTDNVKSSQVCKGALPIGRVPLPAALLQITHKGAHPDVLFNQMVGWFICMHPDIWEAPASTLGFSLVWRSRSEKLLWGSNF